MRRYKKKGKRSVLEKSLTVLEAIVDQPQSVGLPDLAERLGVSRQSLHRLVRQLEQHGLVVKSPNRDRFAIGRRLSRLALATMGSANKGMPTLAIVQEVAEQIGETCILGVIVGREFVYLERADAEHYPRIYLETGSRIPAHCTSGGKVMLAHLPATVRQRMLTTMSFPALTRYTITSPRDLNAELDRIRSRGYSTADQEYAEGIYGVGVPVLGPENEALAALAIHGPTARVSDKNAAKIARKLRAAARRLTLFWNMPG